MLSPNEWTELQWLLVDARHGRLHYEREARLRALLTKRNPAAQTMEWDELVHYGMVIFGLQLVARYANQAAAAEPLADG